MEKKLYKSRSNIKIDGVCAGFANYIGWDVTLVRLLYVGLTLMTSGFPGVGLYIVCALIMPREPKDINDYKDYREYNEN